MELIRLENICKTYSIGEIDVPVLKGVSFSIRRGELVALMGASGSGKSTLMNILGCLDHPTSGNYWLDGMEVGSLSPNQRALVRTAKLGFVFQSFNLLPRTTAVNNVLMPLDYAPNPPSLNAARERARNLLVRVGLSERLDHIPSQMSGGQQQRVAIARSIINEPALLLADEPTGNLDSRTSVEILAMFQQLNAAGITVVLVTHDPKVASYAHRTIRVADGLIEEDRSTASTQVSLGGHAVPVAPPALNGNGHDAAFATGPHLGPSGGGTSTVQLPDTARAAATMVAAPRPEILAEEPSAPVNFEPPETIRKGALPKLVPTTLRTAVGALRRNKMRSALTTLGVIIGVSAVIAMVEISQGSRTALMQTMSTMGANNLVVQSGAARSGGVSFGFGSEKTLTPQDAEEIMRQCPSVASVAPMVEIFGQVVYGNRNWVPMTLLGTTPDYLVVRDWENMEEGEMFTERDVRGNVKVCVIGKTLVKELFDGQSPLGQNIRINNVSLRVVGVLSPKGANMMGRDQDDTILAPWTTLKYRVSDNTGDSAATAAASSPTAAASEINSLSKLYPGTKSLYPEQSAIQAANTPQPVRFTNVDQILVKAASAAEIPDAIAQITSLLHQRHRIRAGQNDDFNIRNMAEILKAMGSTSQMMGGLLLIVALISLAVGGVGIMNIMLVSVTERTREIGLRMAVGARSHHILRQFLIEAVVLCLFGGLMGILVGRGVSLLVWYLLRWPIQASLPAIILACAVSALIGIAFGFYPAWKASRLDPIEALRYE